MRNNPVFQLLFPSGDQTLLAKDLTIDNLAIGQLGIFSRDTNLSIDPVDKNPEIYFAWRTPDDDVKFSTGQMIQANNYLNTQVKCYTPGQNKIVKLSGMVASADSDYAIKIQLRSGDFWTVNGYQLPSVTYSIKTPCDKIASCDCSKDSDCRVLAILLYDEIALQGDDAFLKAEIVDTTGVVVPRNQVDAWLANPANDDECLDLRIEGIQEKIYASCSINLQYNYLRQLDFDVALIEGFQCTEAKVDIEQEVVYEEGLGYDLQQLEYFAHGWGDVTAKYRQYGITGLAKERSFYANMNDKYTQITLLYNLQSISGFKNYLNNTETIIAIPCGDTVTRNDFADVWDKWITANNVNSKLISTELTACTC